MTKTNHKEAKEPVTMVRVYTRLLEPMDEIASKIFTGMSGPKLVNECLEQILRAANDPPEARQQLKIFRWIDEARAEGRMATALVRKAKEQ